MNTYAIETTYKASSVGTITLPSGKVWEDVYDWYVKWDMFHYKLKNESEWRVCDLRSGNVEVSDYKRPTAMYVFRRTPEGHVDYEALLDEKESV